MANKITTIFRDTEEYRKTMNEIGDAISRGGYTVTEALGILELVKDEILAETYMEEDDEG